MPIVNTRYELGVTFSHSEHSCEKQETRCPVRVRLALILCTYAQLLTVTMGRWLWRPTCDSVVGNGGKSFCGAALIGEQSFRGRRSAFPVSFVLQLPDILVNLRSLIVGNMRR